MSQAPHLALHISRSPLLPDLDLRFASGAGSLLSALLTKRSIGAVYDSPHPPDGGHGLNPHIRTIEYTDMDDTSNARHSFGSPLPSISEADVAADNRGPSSQGVIALLNLLDSFDADVSMQVARVRDSVKEAREAISEYKRERREREIAKQAKLKQEQEDTKEIGGDFWLGV